MHFVDKIELGVILGNEQMIVPFDLEHIAGPRMEHRERGEVVDDAPSGSPDRLPIISPSSLCLYRCLASTQTHASVFLFSQFRGELRVVDA